MKRPTVTNLLKRFEFRPEAEVLEPIAASDHFLFERIVSYGHASPPGYWYDQPRDEWVVLLSGAACLRFDGDDETVNLEPGDSMLIPARLRHRVEWTQPDCETVWLALHYRKQNEEPRRN